MTALVLAWARFDKEASSMWQALKAKVVDGLLTAGRWFSDHLWSVIVGVFIGGIAMWLITGLFGCAERKPTGDVPGAKMGVKFESVPKSNKAD